MKTNYNTNNIEENNSKTNKLGIYWMVFSCFIASLMNVAAKKLSLKMESSLIIAIYNSVCTVIAYTFLKVKGISIKTAALPLYIARSVLCMAGIAIFYKYLPSIPLANATAISFVDPMLTTFFAYLFLKESIARYNILGLVLSLVGALFIIKPVPGMFNISSLAVLASTVLWALSNILMKVLSRSEDGVVQVFYVSLITFVSSILLFFYSGSSFPILNLKDILLLCAISLLGLTHYFTLFRALTFADVSVVMPFFFTTVIFSGIWGAIFFKDKHDICDIAGIAIVILTNLYLIGAVSKSRKKTQKYEAIEENNSKKQRSILLLK